MAWVVEGEGLGECTELLEICAAETQIWAKETPVSLTLKKPVTTLVLQVYFAIILDHSVNPNMDTPREMILRDA